MPVKKKTKKNESFFYLGPTIKRGILEKNTVFRGGLPNYLNELLDKNPLIKELIVSEKDYLDSIKEVETKETRLNILYKKVLKGEK